MVRKTDLLTSKKQPKPQVVEKTTKATGFQTIYSNNAKVGVTQWDINVTFSHIVENAEQESVFEELVTVRFSPQYFKALSAVINEAAKQWESVFGELKIGPGQQGNVIGMESAFAALKSSLQTEEKPDADAW